MSEPRRGQISLSIAAPIQSKEKVNLFVPVGEKGISVEPPRSEKNTIDVPKKIPPRPQKSQYVASIPNPEKTNESSAFISNHRVVVSENTNQMSIAHIIRSRIPEGYTITSDGIRKIEEIFKEEILGLLLTATQLAYHRVGYESSPMLGCSLNLLESGQVIYTSSPKIAQHFKQAESDHISNIRLQQFGQEMAPYISPNIKTQELFPVEPTLDYTQQMQTYVKIFQNVVYRLSHNACKKAENDNYISMYKTQIKNKETEINEHRSKASNGHGAGYDKLRMKAEAEAKLSPIEITKMDIVAATEMEPEYEALRSSLNCVW